VRGAAPLDFDRHLRLEGLTTRVTWAPAVWNGELERDLRIFGWEPPGESGVRLVISNPSSIWGRAGLHSRDQLLAMDGAPLATWPELRARLQRLRIGDTVRVRVQRSGGEETFEATIVVADSTGRWSVSFRCKSGARGSYPDACLRR
jgi:predicted metalloprotease with PDZ domain